MAELLPNVLLDLPPNQDPIAVAVVAHGFGDRNGGALPKAIGEGLTERGIAVARVALSEQVENVVMPLAFSAQTERFGETLDAVAEHFPELSRYAVGLSQGGLPVAEAVIVGYTPPDRSILAAAPLSNPVRRLAKMMETDTSRLPQAVVAAGLRGFIEVSARPGGLVAITEEYWSEICADEANYAENFDPLSLVQDLYTHYPTHLVFAGNDRRLGSQREQIENLPQSHHSTIQTLPGADHEFSVGSSREEFVNALAEIFSVAQAA